MVAIPQSPSCFARQKTFVALGPQALSTSGSPATTHNPKRRVVIAQGRVPARSHTEKFAGLSKNISHRSLVMRVEVLPKSTRFADETKVLQPSLS
jgi:hypothetical protein